jgi:hypothetical protein
MWCYWRRPGVRGVCCLSGGGGWRLGRCGVVVLGYLMIGRYVSSFLGVNELMMDGDVEKNSLWTVWSIFRDEQSSMRELWKCDDEDMAFLLGELL